MYLCHCRSLGLIFSLPTTTHYLLPTTHFLKMVASATFIEGIIRYYEKASEANRSTPGRRGCIVELSPETCDELMVTGDLHGHRRNFNLITKKADLANHPRRHLVLQEACHGGLTYPDDGGCMSHAVVEDIAQLKTQFPDRVHFILGNHELAEIGDYPIQKNRKMLNLLFRLGMQTMYGDRADEVRDAMLRFFRTCPIAIRAQQVFISHSVPEACDRRPFDVSLFDRTLTDEDFIQRGSLFRLVWGRDYRPENADLFASLVGAQVLINGHEPCANGYNAPNHRQLILDCCGGFSCSVTFPMDNTLDLNAIARRVERLG